METDYKTENVLTVQDVEENKGSSSSLDGPKAPKQPEESGGAGVLEV